MIKDKLEILKRFEKSLWTTKNGQTIKVKDLTVEHLGNIVKYLQVHLNNLSDPMDDYPSFEGEMAQMYAVQEWESSIKYYNNLQKRVNLFRVYYLLKQL